MNSQRRKCIRNIHHNKNVIKTSESNLRSRGVNKLPPDANDRRVCMATEAIKFRRCGVTEIPNLTGDKDDGIVVVTARLNITGDRANRRDNRAAQRNIFHNANARARDSRKNGLIVTHTAVIFLGTRVE
jgi:hypothetical protein